MQSWRQIPKDLASDSEFHTVRFPHAAWASSSHQRNPHAGGEQPPVFAPCGLHSSWQPPAIHQFSAGTTKPRHRHCRCFLPAQQGQRWLRPNKSSTPTSLLAIYPGTQCWAPCWSVKSRGGSLKNWDHPQERPRPSPYASLVPPPPCLLGKGSIWGGQPLHSPSAKWRHPAWVVRVWRMWGHKNWNCFGDTKGFHPHF